jgi:outer membrane protein assembly factor BamB
VLVGLAGCAQGPTTQTPDLSAPLRTPAFVSAVPTVAPSPAVRWATELPPDARLRAASITVAGDLFMLSTTMTPAAGDPPTVVFESGASTSGRLAHEVVVPRAVSQPFLVGSPASGTVLVTTQGTDPSTRELRALDATSGAVRWVVPAELGGDRSGNAFFHAWGQAGELVIGQVLGDTSSRQPCALCAVDVTTGRVRWRIPGPVADSGLAVGAVVAAGDRTAAVIGTRGDVQLLVVDSATGHEFYRRPTAWPPNAMWPSVMRCGTAVLGVAGDGGSAVVTAYDPTGAVAWTRAVSAPPVVDAFTATAVLSSTDRGIEATACDTGVDRWTWTSGRVARDEIRVTVARSGYAVGNAGAVGIAVDVLTGSPVWRGRAAADNPAQWTGRDYLAWRDDRTLVAYAGVREPVAVTGDDGREHPVFLPS